MCQRINRPFAVKLQLHRLNHKRFVLQLVAGGSFLFLHRTFGFDLLGLFSRSAGFRSLEDEAQIIGGEAQSPYLPQAHDIFPTAAKKSGRLEAASGFRNRVSGQFAFFHPRQCISTVLDMFNRLSLPSYTVCFMLLSLAEVGD